MDFVVGAVQEFGDPGRKIVEIRGTEVAIFRLGSAFYAFENICPHAGGPACQGKMLPLTLEAVGEDKSSSGRVFSREHVNVVCPWHGMEFNIRTGIHPISKRHRLRKIAVWVDQDDVLITL
jgi:nitrite reductase/ring-hydroxylating ferredoxin subunit